MKTISLLPVFYTIFLTLYSVNGTYGDVTENGPISANASLIVLGRSGCGISSTVKQLLGSKKQIMKGNSTDRALLEVYEIPLSSGGFFKIVDVEGLVDGKSKSQDIEVLSILRSLLKGHLEGFNESANFFLIISKIDDSRLHGVKSNFVQTLKRIQMLQEDLYGNTTSNTALLLTRLMSSDKSTRKKPKDKIAQFRGAIRDFTSFSANTTEINVGENLPEEYDLVVTNGQATLPNKENYPHNVFDSLLKIASDLNDTIGQNALGQFINGRNNEEKVIVKQYPNTESLMLEKDNSFFMKLHLSDSEIVETDLSRRLTAVFDSFNASVKNTGMLSFTQLQNYLQSENIAILNQLPNKTLDKVKFFQTAPTASFQLELLGKAFNLTVPEFVKPPMVGYGFDVTQGESLMTTPFVENNLKPNGIGYLLPNFINCSILTSPNQVDIAFYNDTFSDYIQTRIKLLDFGSNETLTDYHRMKGKIGFNIKPNENEPMYTLSAVRELRTIQCELAPNNAIEINKEFQTAINELGSFNSGIRDSVREWRAFFEKYGTHVVSLGYGGGKIEGLLERQSSSDIFQSHSKMNETLQEIIKLGNFSIEEEPRHTFFGGNSNLPEGGIYQLNQQSRDAFLSTWKTSLAYDPIMLDYELKLVPISTFAKLVNITVGEEVEKCTRLLLSGNLIYKRIKRPPPKRPTPTPTSTPSTSRSVETTYTSVGTSITTLIEEESNNSEATPTPTVPTDPDNTEEISSEDLSTTEVVGIKLPTPNPAELPNWVKTEDYSGNTVGQGYNLLTGVVLPTSPFNLGKSSKEVIIASLEPEQECTGSWFHKICHSVSNEKKAELWNNCFAHTSLSVIKGLKIVRIENPYVKFMSRNFSTDAEYKLDRIRTLSGSFFDISEIPKAFVDEIPERVFINDPTSKNHMKIHENEWRYGEMSLESGIKISDEFLDSVQLLAHMSTDLCTINEAWRKFFATFGTHYVKFAYVGQTEKIFPSTDSVSQSNSKKGNYTDGTDTKCDRGFVVLKSSMIIGKISGLLDVQDLKDEVEIAYDKLLNNNLEC